jgi:1,4-dihydroxy-2-naphthoate octaprenyltransferase
MKKRTVMYTALWVFPLLCILIYFLFIYTTVAVVAFFTFWMYMLFVFAILTRARLDIMKKQSRSKEASRVKQLKNFILFIMSVVILVFTVLILLSYAIVYY